jgi:hypothetical protein
VVRTELDLKGGAILFSEMTPPDGGEDAFNNWYDNHHTPNHVRGVPGFISAMRYKSPAGPHYLAVYELQSVDTLQSAEYRQRKFTPDEPTRRMLQAVSGFTRYVAVDMFALAQPEPGLKPLDAPILVCLFLSVPSEHWAELDEWFEREHAPILLSDPDWLMTRRLETISCDPERYTHIILHYLADERALASDIMARARTTDWYLKLAGYRWFRPHSVIYHRRGGRFLKADRAETLTQGERR